MYKGVCCATTTCYYGRLYYCAHKTKGVTDVNENVG